MPILLLSVCFIRGSGNAQTTAAIFPVAKQFAISNSSYLNFAGDFNGDGVTDLAYTDGNSLEIVLSPTSNSPTTVTTQLVCTQGVVQGTLNFADLNNDKKLDLVFTCGGYITILLGNGDGTFQAPAYFATSAQSAILVDLNGDGFLDIAGLVPSRTSSPTPQVAVLLNKGTAGGGVFEAPTQYAAPVGSNNLLAGDFNGDGKQDVVITVDDPNYEAGVYQAFSAFSILYGNGDGTLEAGVSQSFSFTALTVGDFNRDGVTDIAMLLLPATSTSLFTSVQVLLGSTSGTFAQGASLPIAAESPAVTELMTAVALSSNANLDIVVAGNVLDIFAGDGKGGFSASHTYGVSGAQQLLFADLSGSGNQGLIAVTPYGVGQYFPGNGDGTLQAAPGVAASGPVVDVNNDGIADLVFTPPQAGYLGVALGRGDGSFSILNQTFPLSSPKDVQSLMTGDFNGDGKNDVIDIAYFYGKDCSQTNDATLSTFLGSGDGRFQALSTPLALGLSFVSAGITGDFNSDGKLDLILPYLGNECAAGIAFVSGNGDGTFAAPVPLNATQDLQGPGLLVGDLNRDKKLDFVWGDAVFLGNGDGTFKQIPLTIPTASPSSNGLAALVDLNGDGILDAVTSTGIAIAIYAGNGDGTFQMTPFYSVAAGFLAAADVNGDGKQDLLLQVSGVGLYESLAVYLGDGSGNFTQDTHTYYLDGGTAAPARLNSQAPPLANDQNLDLLTSTGSPVGPYTASLVNQTNPAPVKPGPLASTTALVASALTGTPGSNITLTASVLGTNPSASVTFAANGSNLGTAALANGTATLQTSFANPGSYAVTASYPGDSNNTASTSSAVTVVIAAPGFTVAASPASSSVKAGQTATFTFAVTPSGGYTGTVTFSCGALPSEAACAFSPASITSSGSAAASSTLTVTTAAATAMLDPNLPFGPRKPWLPMGGLALAGAIGLGLSAGRTKRWNNRSRLLNSAVLLALLSLAVGGCGGAAGSSTPTNPGTPAGTYTITVTAADHAGGPQQTATVSLIVQ